MNKKLEKTGAKSKEPIKNKGGRPSRNQQLAIQQKLRPYFDAGYTASYTALVTHVNEKTAAAYFKEWTEKLIDSTDFVFQQQAAKARLTVELDKRIAVYVDQIKRLEAKIAVEPKPVWESLLTAANTALAKLSIDKAGILMTPTIDVKIKDILREKYGIDLEKIKQDAG